MQAHHAAHCVWSLADQLCPDKALGGGEGRIKGGWRVLKHPQPKKVCPVIRPDPTTSFIRGVLTLALLWTLPLFHYSLLKLTRITRPACLYFKIHRQLTIVEVLSEGTLPMSVADIHVN